IEEESFRMGIVTCVGWRGTERRCTSRRPWRPLPCPRKTKLLENVTDNIRLSPDATLEVVCSISTNKHFYLKLPLLADQGREMCTDPLEPLMFSRQYFSDKSLDVCRA